MVRLGLDIPFAARSLLYKQNVLKNNYNKLQVKWIELVRLITQCCFEEKTLVIIQCIYAEYFWRTDRLERTI